MAEYADALHQPPLPLLVVSKQFMHLAYQGCALGVYFLRPHRCGLALAVSVFFPHQVNLAIVVFHLIRIDRAQLLAYQRTVVGVWSFKIGRATSELQSLMRISYAVFCLKKKINNYMTTDAT